MPPLNKRRIGNTKTLINAAAFNRVNTVSNKSKWELNKAQRTISYKLCTFLFPAHRLYTQCKVMLMSGQLFKGFGRQRKTVKFNKDAKCADERRTKK